MARKSGPAQDWRPARPMVRPENYPEPEAHAFNSTSETALRHVPASRSRRWTRRQRVTLSDVAAWLLFTLLTAAIMLGCCILLTIVWPTP